MARLTGRLAPLTVEEVAALNPAMRKLIVTTLGQSIRLPVEDRRVEPPYPYNKFAKLVSKIEGSMFGRVSFITFNYDLALDYMLYETFRSTDYCFDDKPSDGIPLMKLHGSMNWFRCTGCKGIAPWELRVFFKRFNWQHVGWGDVRSVTLDLAQHANQFAHCADQPCEPDPVIVPPTWNKAEYHQVINVWPHAARHLGEAENIIVIGYSLPEADQFFRYLFALGTIGDARPQRFWVVDPDPRGDVERRFRDLLGQAFETRFKRFGERFSSAVLHLEQELFPVE